MRALKDVWLAVAMLIIAIALAWIIAEHYGINDLPPPPQHHHLDAAREPAQLPTILGPTSLTAHGHGALRKEARETDGCTAPSRRRVDRLVCSQYPMRHRAAFGYAKERTEERQLAAALFPSAH